MKLSERNFEGGFTLAEVTIAIAVLAFGIILVYSALSMMVTSVHNISDRMTAVYLTQEGLEIMKNIQVSGSVAAGDSSGSAAIWLSGYLLGPCRKGCQADYTTQTSLQLAPYENSFLGLNGDGFYSYDKGAVPTIFKRKITVSPVSGISGMIKVDVLTEWSYRNQSSTFEASEYLYNR